MNVGSYFTSNFVMCFVHLTTHHEHLFRWHILKQGYFHTLWTGMSNGPGVAQGSFSQSGLDLVSSISHEIVSFVGSGPTWVLA